MVRRLWDLFFGWKELGICRNELVLDVGSGDNPCFRADIICDEYLLDNDQRSGKMKIQVYPHQKLVIGDVQSLPFKDKSFDFVVCRHLLEHLEDPAKGIEELMRVGRRGYIETPSALMEVLYGWPFHKWLVRLNEGRIIFTQKNKNHTYGILSDKIKKDRNFEKLVNSNLDVFLVKYQWNEKINYQIELSEEISNKSAKKFGLSGSEVKSDSISSSRGWFKNFILKIPRILWSRRRLSLLDIIACPICKDKAGLSQKNTWLICQKCNKSYRVWNDMPILLPE